LIAKLKDPAWTASAAAPAAVATPEIAILAKTMAAAVAAHRDPLEAGAIALAGIATLPAKPAPPAEQGKGKPGVAAPAGGRSSVAIPEIPLTPKSERQAGLPQFYEGDQYAIDELQDQSRNGARKDAPPPSAAAQAAAAMGGAPGVATPAGGFDADFDVVTPVGADEDESGVMDVKLPENIAALLEQSAKKLNAGLGGAEKSG